MSKGVRYFYNVGIKIKIYKYISRRIYAIQNSRICISKNIENIIRHNNISTIDLSK